MLSVSTNKKQLGPYFNTSFVTTIGLHPSQMTKKIYENLKDNLIKAHQNKCFGPYGYISKIYSIVEREGGIIVPENMSSSAMYRVKFTCKLCRPLCGSTIVCQVVDINKATISVQNGPIIIVIMDGFDMINKEKFMYSEVENVWLYMIEKGQRAYKIVVGSYVTVKCIELRIERGSNIFVWGVMEGMPTKEEIEQNNIMAETDDLQYAEFDDYISNESTIKTQDEAEYVSEENMSDDSENFE